MPVSKREGHMRASVRATEKAREFKCRRRLVGSLNFLKKKSALILSFIIQSTTGLKFLYYYYYYGCVFTLND